MYSLLYKTAIPLNKVDFVDEVNPTMWKYI